MKVTPKIRFNLMDRGRKDTGQKRSWDLEAISDAIMSRECQERVRNRDMIGYLGHWPRVRFGMAGAEGGIADGKAHAVEPAIVTVKLSANSRGDIEHQTEFLNTQPGQIAQRMFDSSVGGFSTAIDQSVPRFFGMDYVQQPNYLSNSFRGVTLDDALSGNAHGLSIEHVMAAEDEEQQEAIRMLLDAMDRLHADRAKMIKLLDQNRIPFTADSSLPLMLPTHRAEVLRGEIDRFAVSELSARRTDGAAGDRVQQDSINALFEQYDRLRF